MRERFFILHEANLDPTSRVHFSANDSRCFLATLVTLRANQSHRVNIRAAQTAFPKLRRVWASVADLSGAGARTRAERFREAIQGGLRKPEGLKTFVSETNVDCEPRAMLFLAGVDALEHVAQPCATFLAVLKLQEEVTPIPHQDGHDYVVLNVAKVVLQISRGQARAGALIVHCVDLPLIEFDAMGALAGVRGARAMRESCG